MDSLKNAMHSYAQLPALNFKNSYGGYITTNFRQAVTHVRRRMGILFLWDKEDFMWMLEQHYLQNKELYDRLAKL